MLEDEARAAVAALASAEAVVLAHRQDAGAVVELRVFGVSAGAVVSQVAGPASRFELSLLRPAELLAELVAWCGLHERTPAPVEALTCSLRTFIGLLEAPAGADAGALLRADGAGGHSGEALARAAGTVRRLAEVTVLHRPGRQRVAGTTTGWIDAGDNGLWAVDAPTVARSGDPGTYGELALEVRCVTLTPVTLPQLLVEIVSGLPPGLVDIVSDGQG